ncbi:MAG: hypothetical protein WD342_07325 [Verrucomicrobiales bacterium]
MNLDQVIDYLSNNPNEHGLTAEKVRRRATIVDYDEWPGCIVFEMERHQPALGPNRPKGDMAAWAVARRRYVFDPAQRELHEAAVIGKSTLDCDIGGLAITETERLAFSCTRSEDGRVICEEACSNAKREVFSREDAEVFGRSVVKDWTFEGLFFETYGLGLGGQVGEAVGELHEECENLAGEAAVTAWDDMEEEAG